ncbi:unnamed protein product, partial [Owenia fusiformis]
MGDWGAMEHINGGNDFLAMLTAKSRTPTHRAEKSELLFTPSPQKPGPEGASASSVYGADETVEDSIKLLNQDLLVLGFPSMYDGAATFKLSQLVSSTQQLLHMHQRSMRIKEDLENRQCRTETDINHLQVTQGRLKDSLKLCQRDIAGLQEKERQLVNKNKLLTSKLKAEKDEVKRLQSVILSRDSQYKHEMKKREKEINKLKERMHQLLTDKNQERRLGMDILNALQRPDGKRGTWKTNNKQEEDMYRLIITNYEDRQKELMLENKELRECLVTMQKELISLLNQQPSPSKSSNLEDSLEESEDDIKSVTSTDVEELADGYFQMPYEMVRDGIQKSLKEKYQLLKRRINQTEKSNPTSEGDSPETPRSDVDEANYKEQIETLSEQVSRYRDIIEQQEDLIQHSLQTPDNDDTIEQSFLHNSELLEEAENLSKEKALFYQQKCNFEKERQTFTEAAIRLGRERKMFEDEKSGFLQHQFKQATQSSVHKPRSAMHKFTGIEGGARLVSANANLTPSPTHSAIKTPSTVDLYRSMGLKISGGSQSSVKSSPYLGSFHGSTTSSKTSSNKPAQSNSASNKSSRKSSVTSSHSSSGCRNISPSSRVQEHMEHV